LKSAFDKVDIDIELQKEEYEYKIGELNQVISDLDQSKKNVL